MNGRQARTARRQARQMVAETVDVNLEADAKVNEFRGQLKTEVEQFARERAVLYEIARLARIVASPEAELGDSEQLTVALDALDEVRRA